jgi:hypothetical protein
MICYFFSLSSHTGNLTKADKEMIVVATSAENKCLYCIVAHSALHRIYAKNPYLADQVLVSFYYIVDKYIIGNIAQMFYRLLHKSHRE